MTEQVNPNMFHKDPAEQEQQDIRMLEALLFAAVEPLPIRYIVDRFPEARRELIPDLLLKLQESYASRGVHLVRRDGAWCMRTAPDLENVLEQEKHVHKKLSKAAMETLSIVAYHQPVTRAEIESIRGVATSKGTLDLLMEAGWVKPGRRRQVPGRPLTWITTLGFLDHFDLASIKDLPGVEELKAAGLLDARPAIETVPRMEDMDDMFDKLGEDEEEASEEDIEIVSEDEDTDVEENKTEG